MIKKILLTVVATAGLAAMSYGAATPGPSTIAFHTATLTDSNGNNTIWVTDNTLPGNPRCGDPTSGFYGSNYWAQLYVGFGDSILTDSSLSANVPAVLPLYPVNFQDGGVAGYVQESGAFTDLGQFVNTAIQYTNSLGHGKAMTIQMRAWYGGIGGTQYTTYEQAVAAGPGDPNSRWGKSGLIYINPTGDPLGSPPTVPADLIDENTGFSDVLAFELDSAPPCPGLTVSATAPGSPVSGTVGTAISSITYGASGGTGPYTFSVSSGALPGGLTLSSGGVLSGTPTNSGVFNATIHAADTAGCFGIGTTNYVFNISCPTITVTPPSLANGTLGVPYNTPLGASGGTSPYSFAVTSGGLPPGLSLSGAGVLHGTVLTGGTSNFTVTATDTYQCFVTKNYSITFSCPTITLPGSLPNGTVGVPYNQSVGASGGSGTYTYAVGPGSLPVNYSLDPNTGAITGTCTNANNASFTITATDTATGCTGSQPYTLNNTCPAITVSPASLPNAPFGAAYSQQISASGGGGGYTFTITSGGLPPNLSMTAGLISGTNTQGACTNLTVTVTDQYGCSTNKNYTICGACATITLSSSPSPLLGGTTGSNYSGAITASGGTTPYTFTQNSGTLPGGVTLASDGTLSGVATTAGTFNFSVVGTDANGCTGTNSYSITIGSPFAGAGATWYGLFQDANPANSSRHTDGYISLTKNVGHETFTGRIALDGQVCGFSGSFDTNGNGTANHVLIPRVGKPSLYMSLAVNVPAATLGGSISNLTEGWYSVIDAYQSVFSTASPANQLKGSYSMLIPGTPGSAILPGGDGLARITIQANGMVLVQLSSLGEGTALVPWSSPVAANGDYPLFAQLYGLKGVIYGWLNFTNPPSPTFTGSLRWEKPNTAPATGYYDAGFSNNVTVLGSSWVGTLPLPGHDDGVTQPAPSTLTIQGGGLLTPIVNHFTLVAGHVTMTPPIADAGSLSYSYSFGGYLGLTFLNPLHPSPMTTGRGVYLQTQNIGGGWFKGTSGQYGVFNIQ